MKTKILGLLAVGLLAAMPAQAFIFTLDNATQTVVRPTSGNLDVHFNGTVGLETGETVSTLSLKFPFLDDGTTGLSGNITCLFCGDGGSGSIFTIRVQSTSALGLYDNWFENSGPATFSVSAQLANGAVQSITLPYSINVVNSVPEPGSLALLGLGLAGLGLSRRRKAN